MFKYVAQTQTDVSLAYVIFGMGTRHQTLNKWSDQATTRITRFDCHCSQMSEANDNTTRTLQAWLLKERT
jgi:hypothetical protein